MSARKAKSWAVILSTPGQPIRTEYTSEAKAYEKARETRDAVKAGASRVTRIRVEKWAADLGHWQLFDLIDPKKW